VSFFPSWVLCKRLKIEGGFLNFPHYLCSKVSLPSGLELVPSAVSSYYHTVIISA
jgi:hypothetical protein